jgi:hypothetical protein
MTNFVATVTADGNAIGTLTNNASVSSAATDPAMGDNAIMETTTVNSPASLTASMTANPTLLPEGGLVTYTVVLSNTLPTPQNDNPTAEFENFLPPELTLANAVAGSGTITLDLPGNRVEWNGAVPGSGQVVITITATVNAGTLGTTINNQGTAFFDADGNGSNESSITTDDPSVGGAGDPTGISIVNLTSVPTLNRPGLLVLLGLLLWFGFRYQKKLPIRN